VISGLFLFPAQSRFEFLIKHFRFRLYCALIFSSECIYKTKYVQQYSLDVKPYNKERCYKGKRQQHVYLKWYLLTQLICMQNISSWRYLATHVFTGICKIQFRLLIFYSQFLR
jgi:hypothetical protein